MFVHSNFASKRIPKVTQTMSEVYNRYILKVPKINIPTHPILLKNADWSSRGWW